MNLLFSRHRRLRVNAVMRNMVRETNWELSQLIDPIFVTEGQDICEPIPSMPGVSHYSLDKLIETVSQRVSLGLQTFLIFGVPETKDPEGRSADDDDGIVQKAIRTIKKSFPDVLVIADTCLCQFTDHGHCGLLEHAHHKNETVIENDRSLERLASVAVSQAKAGADVIAPSNMMDGFVTVIRQALDQNGYKDVALMSYSVKYASAYYGPFRDAAHSTPQFGDRKTYQMDPANIREALREAKSDVEEGADILIVKPALAYMDVIRAVKEETLQPVAAYNVSAEYAMVKAAAANGWIDERAIVEETITGFRRAGADLIITYHARDLAKWRSNRDEPFI